MSNKRSNFVQFFNDYVLYWVDAIKYSHMGRPSRGGLYGFRKNIRKTFEMKFCNFNNNVTLFAKFNNISLHFIPCYLNGSSWANDFEVLKSTVINLRDTSYCIIGDLNCRISNEQMLNNDITNNFPLISSERSSKDNTLDSKGRQLLSFLDDCGGIILNGRFKSDSSGEKTFCGVMGSSVIDYCICSLDILNFLTDFRVESKPFSDHMPLSVSFSIVENENSRAINLPQKIPWFPKNCDRYKINLSNLVNQNYIQSNLSAQEKLDICVHKIQSAANINSIKKHFIPKNDWYDAKCENFRRRMLKSLDNYRETNSDYDRIRYINNRSKYMKLCDEKKLAKQISNINKLNLVKDSAEWWKLANSLRRSTPKVGNNLSCTDFYNHFEDLLCGSSSTVKFHWCLDFRVDPFLDSPFEFRELKNVLQFLKLGKAPGEDRISYEFYINAPFSYLEELLFLYNHIFLTECIPESFLRSIIIPCFKKGDINTVSNYRGLSLLDSVYKIFTGLILNRLNSWLECNNILTEFQAGFRKNYSTVDNLFNLTSIVNLNFYEGKRTYAFFVDFSAAFDRIPRNALLYKLAAIGLSSKMLNILRMLYDGTSCKVWDGSSLSDSFVVSQGVKQGCLLSPVLFSIYLNDLDDCLPCGVNIAGTIVKVLMYADDIVLLAESPTDLQKMIDALYIYNSRWSLKLNLDKSKVMVFRKSNRLPANLRWYYDSNIIELVNEYKYLGIILSFNLSFTKHLQSKLASAKLAINANWLSYIFNPKITISNKLKIFNAAAKSIMFYGCQIWGFKSYEEVEKLFRYFIKKILYLPTNTPNYMLHIETGLPSLFNDTLELHFSYIRKVFKLSLTRLPRVLAEEAARKKTYWYTNWVMLCNQVGENFDFQIWRSNMFQYHSNILQLIKANDTYKFIQSAKNSLHHDMYSILQYNGPQYFSDNLTAYCISMIFKARGGLLFLNGNLFQNTVSPLCTICNLDEVENTAHLIGKCPIYSDMRFLYFGKRLLTYDEVINILNGRNYMQLYKYLMNCLNYRKLIISEFV